MRRTSVYNVTRVLLVAFVSATSAPTALQAQSPRALGRPDAEYREPFSQLSSVRELSDGRLIVADTRERTLQLIDLRTGTATPIARQGSGPAEFQVPSALYALRADKTMVQDPPNSRFLILGPDGKPARTFSPAQEEARRGGGGGSGAGGTLRATDAAGLMYYQAPGIVVAPDGRVVPADSAAIVRYTPATLKHDTVAFVRVPRQIVQALPGGGRYARGLPFDLADEWDVFADGRVAVVRASPYRVEIVSPNGTRSVGQAVPYSPPAVTEADKATFLEALRGNRPLAVVSSAAGRGPAGGITLPEPTEWASTMPPFDRSYPGRGRAMWATPGGEIWVLRSAAAGNKPSVVDVFDQKGQRSGQVTLPENASIVGFGAKSVYLGRRDADDLQYLQRISIR
jgi:hypothetical protein